MDISTPTLQQRLFASQGRFDLWQSFITHVNVRTMLEVGVWQGDFAATMLKSVDSLERYWMIDPWANLPDWNKPFNVRAEKFEAVYEEAMLKVAFARDRVTVLRGRTKDVASRLDDNSIDFIYIDGDHTLRGITLDLLLLLSKVRPGGFIGGDDFTKKPWRHGARFEPTLVCPFVVYFAEAMDLPIHALPYGQFLLQKTTSSGFQFVDQTGEYSDLSLNRLLENPSWMKQILRRLIRQWK